MTEMTQDQVLAAIADDPGRFDAQRYWGENPDIQNPMAPNGQNGAHDKWALTWGSFTGQGGREIGGALTHFLRSGAEEGRQGHLLEGDNRDETYSDIYAGEFMTAIPNARAEADGANQVTLARMFDMGLLHIAGVNDQGEQKLRFSWDDDALPNQTASAWGRANDSLYQGIAGLYVDSGVDPTMETMKLLPNTMQGMNFNEQETAAVNRFIAENTRALAGEGLPTGDDIAQAAQDHIDQGPLRTFEDALAATLLGGTGAQFQGGDGGTFQLPDSVANFVERAGLPPIPDPFEGIDPATGLTYEEMQQVRRLQVSGELAIKNTGTVLGSTHTAVMDALAANPASSNLAHNPFGIGESGLGTLGTLLSPFVPGAGIAGQAAASSIDAGIVKSIFEQAGVGQASELSGTSDFFSNAAFGIGRVFGASPFGQQAAGQMLSQPQSGATNSVLSLLPPENVTSAQQALGMQSGVIPRTQQGGSNPRSIPHQILPGSTPFNPAAIDTRVPVTPMVDPTFGSLPALTSPPVTVSAAPASAPVRGFK